MENSQYKREKIKTYIINLTSGAVAAPRCGKSANSADTEIDNTIVGISTIVYPIPLIRSHIKPKSRSTW
ncbi:MAG: hypothetical protein Q4B31_05470 [Clostridia bacterium]|nr:hypothetical protein [Clostridia bacterium]